MDRKEIIDKLRAASVDPEEIAVEILTLMFLDDEGNLDLAKQVTSESIDKLFDIIRKAAEPLFEGRLFTLYERGKNVESD
jgi:hypothetical protein